MFTFRTAFRAIPLMLAIVVLPCVSHADDTKPEEKARILFEEGKTARDAKDFATALRLFRESHETFPSESLESLDALVNVADCEKMLGKTAAAYLHYGEFLRNVKVRDDRVTEVTAIMASMMKTGPWIRIGYRNALEANAVVRIDGVSLGPITGNIEEIPAEAGEHAITITEPTKGERKITANVEAGKHHVVNFRPKVPPKAGVDIQPVGPEPPKPLPHWVLPAGIIIGIGGVFSTVPMGAVFASGMAAKTKALEKDCAKDDGNGNTCDPAKVPDLDFHKAEIKRLATATTTLFVVGGALTAATVVLILVNRSKSTEVAFAPLVVPGGGGLAIAGQF